MDELLKLNLVTSRPLTFIVTEEEDRLIQEIYEFTKAKSDVLIYKTTTGLISYDAYIKEPEKRERVIDQTTMPLHVTLAKIQTDVTTDKRAIYILLDIDHLLQEAQNANHQNIRKIKDVILNIYKDSESIKSVILVSPILCVPTKLQRYSEVLFFNLPDENVIEAKIQKTITEYNEILSERGDPTVSTHVDTQIKQGLKSLTLFEVDQITMSSFKKKKRLDIDEVNAYKKSILKKTDMLDFLETDVTFDQIGGLERIKGWVNERQDVWTEEALNLKIPMSKGLLSIGITGCGKSLLSKAIASQWKLPLIMFSPGKIFSPRVGETDTRLIRTLKIIESVAPCVVLIDEIEKQFSGSQSSTFSDAGTTSRFIGSFLTWYEDYTAPIFIVATCNSIEYLPPELISRFDDKFFVPLPSSHDRRSIYEIQLKKFGRDSVKNSLDLEELSLQSPYFTGREIEQVVKSSLIKMWNERRTTGADIDLEQRHLLQVIDSKVPIYKTMQNELDYLVQWVGWDDKKKDGVRANYASSREDDIDQLFAEILAKDSVLDRRKKC